MLKNLFKKTKDSKQVKLAKEVKVEKLNRNELSNVSGGLDGNKSATDDWLGDTKK